MKQFTYVIQDPLGIHARPAGALVKAAKPFADTAIQVVKGDKSVKATQLMKLMGLGVKTGDEITVTAEGPSEEAAIAAHGAVLQGEPVRNIRKEAPAAGERQRAPLRRYGKGSRHEDHSGARGLQGN